MRNPLKQGLKHSCVRLESDGEFIAMRNPLKQGLKHSNDQIFRPIHPIAMRNPLKQGLKLPKFAIMYINITISQCEIH